MTDATVAHDSDLGVSLDGEWRIALDPDDSGLRQAWFTQQGFPQTASRPIQVPGNVYEAWPRHNGVSWYRRSFAAPPKHEKDARQYLRLEILGTVGCGTSNRRVNSLFHIIIPRQ